jgi:mannose-1-phosphate guanylyltransferase
MKQPLNPFPPSHYEYDEKVERKYIYSYSQNLDEDYDPDEDDKDYKDDDKTWNVKDISAIDLAWLISQIPEGVTPSQIKIEFGYNASSMSYEDHYVRFYYEVTIPARKEEYKAAQKKYKKDLEQYEKEMFVYEANCLAKEIEETKAKLARLTNEHGFVG